MCLNHALGQFDAEKADAFANRLIGTLNEGALCAMLSIGHRTGLFDALDAQPPLTSVQIASRAGLNERYVREWLGAMVTGNVVEYDSVSKTYSLPAEHAAHLTRAAGPGNLAAFAEMIGAWPGLIEAAAG